MLKVLPIPNIAEDEQRIETLKKASRRIKTFLKEQPEGSTNASNPSRATWLIQTETRRCADDDERQNRQSTGQENLRQTPYCRRAPVCSHAGDGADQTNAKRPPESEWPVAAYACCAQSKKDTRLWL